MQMSIKTIAEMSLHPDQFCSVGREHVCSLERPDACPTELPIFEEHNDVTPVSNNEETNVMFLNPFSETNEMVFFLE